MKTATARYIDANEETMAKLAKVFNCTEKTVYLALTYRRDSELARKIRYTAVKNHGATPMRHCPECETMYLTTEDGRQIMRQNFDNGVVLSVDRETGDAVMRDRSGGIISSWPKISLSKLTEIQLYAESL